MILRLSSEKDIDKILEIINDAKVYLRSQGVDQWQDGYPNREVIEIDIKDSCSFVLEDEGTILGTTVIGFDGESTYDKIYEGKWLNNDIFAAIHRMAVDKKSRNKGIADILIKNIENLVQKRGIRSIKVDTHKNNKVMQNFLIKNGFIYCGIIYLQDGNERVAFEKLI